MQNIQSKSKIVLFIILIVALMIIVLGLLGHVGLVTIFKRLFIYIPLFIGMFALLFFLLDLWVDETDIEQAIIQKANKKNKSYNQASNLGQSLDIKDVDVQELIYSDNTIENMKIEPQKAAQAIRQMLAQDKEED